MTDDDERHLTAEETKLTWDGMRDTVNALALHREEWAGYPMVIYDLPLRLNPRLPMAEMLDGACFIGDKISTRETRALERDRLAAALPADEPVTWVRNEWFSHQHQAWVKLWQRGDKVAATIQPVNFVKNALALGTLGVAASHAWDVEAELVAMTKLQALLSPHAFRCYMLTNTFLESSPRSGVTYWFRKLRPTLVIRPTRDGKDTHITAALCLHPIGYYEGSYAGAMVPTDDVIAHLLLMRGDEPDFWRQANQHPAWAAEAGI